MSGLTLVVLAAGMGSRYGKGIKQLEPLGPSGELLIDYSVYDAIRAGFDRVVFIIRKDIEELFKQTIGNRIAQHINTEYVFQSPDILPTRSGDFPSRTKPWGTAQALYCCREVLDGPFAVINADDFYGKEAFMQLAAFLNDFNASACSVDFVLKNTLSQHGAVNRGICRKNSDGLLVSVEETKGISQNENGIIRGTFCGEERELSPDDSVSMSMWGFNVDFMRVLERRLSFFISSLDYDEPKAELTIADVVGAEIQGMPFTVRDIPTDSKWFGITFESDADAARETLKNYTAQGVYPSPLWKE